MSKSVKVVLGLAMVSFVAACASREPEPAYVAPPPVVAEPTYSKF